MGASASAPPTADDDEQIPLSPLNRRVEGEAALLHELPPEIAAYVADQGSSAHRASAELFGAGGGGAGRGGGSATDDEDDEDSDDDVGADPRAKSTGRRGRKGGSKNVGWCLESEFPHDGSSLEELSDEMLCHERLNWTRRYGGARKFEVAGVFKCVSHPQCGAQRRLSSLPDEAIYRIENNGTDHSGGELLPWSGKGIGGEFRAEIADLCSKGFGPEKVLADLRVKYSQGRYADNNKYGRIPSIAKIRAYKESSARAGDYDITSYAELIEWVTPRLAQTKEQVEQIPRLELDALKVFRTFQAEAEVVGEDGKTKKVQTMGIIFGSKRTLLALDHLKKEYGTISLQVDGTYRVHIGGWVLCDAGSTAITWGVKAKNYVQSFIPLAYMFCRTECSAAYLQFLSVIKDDMPRLLGHDTPLDVDVGGIDRTAYIKDAFRAVWPQVRIVICWPHIARKITEGEFRKALANSENMPEIEWGIRALHSCRSVGQFDLLGSALVAYWTDVLIEPKFAQYFVKIYMTVSASACARTHASCAHATHMLLCTSALLCAGRVEELVPNRIGKARREAVCERHRVQPQHAEEDHRQIWYGVHARATRTCFE